MSKFNRMRFYQIYLKVLKQKRWLRKLIAFFLFPVAYVISYFNSYLGTNLLIKIYLTDLTLFDRAVAMRIKKLLPKSTEHFIKSNREIISDAKAKLIVVKSNISENEKGVIILHWRWYIDILLRDYDFESILKRYIIILEIDAFGAEWTHTHFALRNVKDSIVFTAIKNKNSIRRLNMMGFLSIPYGLCSDYINTKTFSYDSHIKKENDIIMIAHWSIPIKRHYVLFRALRKIDNPLKVVLIGFPCDGYTMEDVKKLESCFELKHDIIYYENICSAQVNQLLNKSKMFVLTSLMEGPNRACFESFFANVPVIVLSGNLGIPKEYFNNQTGLVVNEWNLHRSIEYLLENYSKYTPREWAINNITPQLTVNRINSHLKNFSIANGMDWTEDIVAKQWYGQKFQYVDEGVRKAFLRDYAFVEQCFHGSK